MTNSSQGARQVSEGSQGEQGEGVPREKQASAESDAGRTRCCVLWVPAYATRGVRHLQGVAYAGPTYPVMCVAALKLPDYATTRRRNDLGRAI